MVEWTANQNAYFLQPLDHKPFKISFTNDEIIKWKPNATEHYTTSVETNQSEGVLDFHIPSSPQVKGLIEPVVLW